MNIIGRSTIHPIFFYTGKISGYILWILYGLSLFHIVTINGYSTQFSHTFSYYLLSAGLLLILISSINLGRSTRLGLPSENTQLKKSGIYTISRNPMYVGFDFLTLSSMIFHGNSYLVLFGIYSIVIYHFIILGEERFLEKRFGESYMAYQKSVRRYF